MRHVVVGTISPIPDIDVFCPGDKGDAVHHGTEGAKLVLFMDRLEDCIHVQMTVNVKQAVQMDVVKAFAGMALRNQVAIGRKTRSTGESGSGTISGKAAVSWDRAKDRLLHAGKGSSEAAEHFLDGFRSEFGPLLTEGRRSGCIGVEIKEIAHILTSLSILKIKK